MTTVIGIDFDNTLVSYDELIYRAALERGLIGGGAEAGKRAVRDRIRLAPGGEIEWQKLQALVYGPLMPQAQLIAGAREFVRACRSRGFDIYIVSHKTEFAGYDETGTNLRDAAISWMAAQGFFERGGLGFDRAQVFFEPTRDAKIERIRGLHCTHFIDDLEEVFLEPGFPPDVRKLLYAPGGASTASREIDVMPSWPAIHDHFFAAAS
jgi:hypothetical protein